LSILVLSFACLAAGCGKAKVGRIEGMKLSDCDPSDLCLAVKLDDGRSVTAARGKDKNQGSVTGGQRVKVVPKDGTQCWEVVEWLR
jgi:hypothetical protein